MAKFPNALEAYRFAWLVLERSRSPKHNSFEFSEGVYGAPKEFQRLDAIAIMARAELCDAGNKRRVSFFADYYLPDPQNPPPRWDNRELRQLNKALADFECALCGIDFIPRCGEKCREKKGAGGE